MSSLASMVSSPYDSIVRSVIEKFEARAAFGLKKYGTNLDRNDLSICEWINHAQEEHMDAILYLEKLKQELSFLPTPNHPNHFRTLMKEQERKKEVKEQEQKKEVKDQEHQQKKKEEREKNRKGCADCSVCFPGSYSCSCLHSSGLASVASSNLPLDVPLDVPSHSSAFLTQTRAAFLRLKKQQEFHEGLRGK